MMDLKTWLIQFTYDKGNGWALVNARTEGQAQQVFYTQTKYLNAHITSLVAKRYLGCEMQLVYEGTVSTIGKTPYDLAVLNGFEGTLEQYLATLKGEKGDKGDKGDKGQRGDAFTYEDFTPEQLAALKGERGIQGIPGPQGPVGPVGPAGEISIVDNLTTDDATKALSARQGYVVGKRLENCYTMANSLLTFSIEVGKQRVKAYGYALSNSDIRCTISNVLGVEDLTNAKMMVSPRGYQTALIQAKALQSDTEYLDTGWQSGSYEISALLNNEYPYKIFNFRRADNATISQQDSETIANECHLVFEAKSAIDFIGKNGSIAKSVFNDNDTEKVEVYTKDAVDGMVGNSYTAGVSRLTFAIEVGKQRVPAYAFALSNSSTRCTISEILSVEDLAYAKRMVSPQGYQAAFLQAKALSKNADKLDTGWKGGSFAIEDILDDEYPYKLFNFRRTDNGNVSDSDGVIIANGFYVEIEIQSAMDFIDKNGTIVKSVVNASDTEKVEVYTKDAVDELTRQAVGLVAKGDGSMTYAGAPINLSRNTFEKVALINPMQGTGRQGGAAYGQYFFQFYTNNPYIEVYELGETAITLKQTITLTENENNHAGSGGFGAKYDENDPFPLLYIGSMDEYKVYVYRLTGEVGSLTIQLHQTITLPPATELMYLPNIAIDAVSNELIVFGYTKDTWRDGTGNKSVVAYYDIPPTLGDQTVSVNNEKARYYLPFVYAMQGACVNNGKLYLLWGNVATTQGGGLIVFHKGIIESSLDFAAVGRYEPEAIGIYNDALYVSTQSGRMVKLVPCSTDKVVRVDKTTDSATAFVLDPGKLYDFGERTTLDISLSAYSGSDIPIYSFTFVSGSTPTTLSVPATWEIVNGELIVESGYTYEFNVQGNLCVYGKFKTA